MKSASPSDFADAVMKMAPDTEPFRPIARYDPDGDCIEFFAKPDSFYGERIDELVTVYYSQDTHEVIGSLIKGVSEFCRGLQAKLPGLVVEIHDGRIQLQHLFRAHLWSAKLDPKDLRVISYRKLIEIAEQSETETEVCA